MRGEWIADCLKRIEYKDNWTFQIRCIKDTFGEDEGMIEWQCKMIVKNAHKPNEMITVNSLHLLEVEFWKERSPTDLFEFCLHEIKKLENHEAEEWFKVDGRQLADPHSLGSERWLR